MKPNEEPQFGVVQVRYDTRTEHGKRLKQEHKHLKGTWIREKIITQVTTKGCGQ